MADRWPGELVEGARREARLVWLSAWQPRETDKVRAAFASRFPFVEVEAVRVTHPFALIEEERGAASRRVDCAGPITGTLVAQYAERGYFLEHRSAQAEALDGVFQDAKGRWYSTHSMGMPMAYNRERVPADRVPQSYDDLFDPWWKGKILMEDIRHWGTSAEWANGVHRKLGEDFFRRLATMEVQWYREGAVTGALDAVASGEALLAPWAVDYMVQLRIDAGEPLGWANPLNLGRVPAHVTLATAPHPHAARLFTDWLLSEEGQTLVGRENLGFPARPGVPGYMAQFYPPDVTFDIAHPTEVLRQKPVLLAMYERVFFAR